MYSRGWTYQHFIFRIQNTRTCVVSNFQNITNGINILISYTSTCSCLMHCSVKKFIIMIKIRWVSVIVFVFLSDEHQHRDPEPWRQCNRRRWCNMFDESSQRKFLHYRIGEYSKQTTHEDTSSSMSVCDRDLSISLATITYVPLVFVLLFKRTLRPTID